MRQTDFETRANSEIPALKPTANVCRLYRDGERGTVFFNVLLEMPSDRMAVVLHGFKYHAGKIYPPAKPWKGHNYVSASISPVLAKAIASSLRQRFDELGMSEPELDENSWVSMKWGQQQLKKAMSDDDIALELWKQYHAK